MVTKHVKLHKTNEKRCVGFTKLFVCHTQKKCVNTIATCISVVIVATISHKILCDIHICFYIVKTYQTVIDDLE